MNLRAHWPLFVACLAYLAFRLIVLHTNFAAVSMPQYELTGIGNLALILSEDITAAPLHLVFDNNGGHILAGILGSPLYAIFGSSYFTLKLVSLALGLLLLILTWKLMLEEVSRRAAILAVFLQVLAPPTLTKYSLLVKGNHFENLPFQVLTLLAFFAVHRSTGSSRTRWLWVASASAGFSIFVYFGSLALLACLLLLHLLTRGVPKFLLDLRIGIPGFLLGLSPLIWFETQTQGRGFQVMMKNLGRQRQQLDSPLERFTNLITEVLPQATCYEDLGALTGDLANWCFLLLFCLTWLALTGGLVRKAIQAVRESAGESQRFQALRSLPFALYLPLIAIALTFGSRGFEYYAPPLEVGTYRILVPHIFLAQLLIVAVADRWLASEQGPVRLLGKGVLALTFACGLFTLPIADWSFNNTGIAAASPGYHLPSYNAVFLKNVRTDPETRKRYWQHDQIAKQLDAFQGSDARDVYSGLGFGLSWSETMGGRFRPRLEGKLPFGPSLEALCAPYAEENHPALARGLGELMRLLYINSVGQRAELPRLIEERAANGHPLFPYFVEGLAIKMGYAQVSDCKRELKFNTEVRPLIPERWRSHWDRGEGMTFGKFLRRALPWKEATLRNFLQSRSEGGELSHDFWFGVGWGWVRGRRELDSIEGLLEWLPESEAPNALLGVGAAMRFLSLEASASELDTELRGLGEEERSEYERGLQWESFPEPIKLR